MEVEDIAPMLPSSFMVIRDDLVYPARRQSALHPRLTIAAKKRRRKVPQQKHAGGAAPGAAAPARRR